MLLGDSITAGSGGDTGWHVQANGRAGFPLRFISNAGVGGDRTDQMLARIDTDVIDLLPDVCIVLGGTNDVGQGVSAATIQGYLSDIYDALEAEGIAIVACTIPPRGDLDAGEDTTLLAVNDWIEANYSNWSNAYLCDWNDEMTLSGAEGVDYDPDLFSDHVHPNAAGHKVMGSVLGPVLASAFAAYTV